jgi:hypothetical protein
MKLADCVTIPLLWWMQYLHSDRKRIAQTNCVLQFSENWDVWDQGNNQLVLGRIRWILAFYGFLCSVVTVQLLCIYSLNKPNSVKTEVIFQQT